MCIVKKLSVNELESFGRMKVLFDQFDKIKELTTATIGIFDGVHMGHKSIINLMRDEASRKGLSSCVITFFPHPQQVLSGSNIPLIVPLKERFWLLEKAGVDITVCFNFTEEFSRISAEDFVKKILVDNLNVKSIYVGPDLFFGRNRKGNVDLLKAMGKTYGFITNLVGHVYLGNEVISSTSIRKLIEQGRVNKAAILLGDCFSIEGKVIEGQKRGRKLGYPTANLQTEWELLPKVGVYATWAVMGEDRFKSITNVGYRPTFGNNKLLVETYIMEYNEEIYGETLRVLFVERIRDEKKFESVNALIKQIEKDVVKASEILV